MVGFELQVDSGTNVFYHWCCTDATVRASMRADLWRGVALGGSDAQVEVLDNGKPTRKVVPGKPLTVRVTDLDVNLDPSVKETVSVTLRCGDEARTLTLEETGPDTGIFAGTIATHVGAEKPEEKSLAVRAGKEVVVEYLDRVRGDGTRDVPVRAVLAAP